MASSLVIEIGAYSIRAALSQNRKIYFIPLGYSDSTYSCPSIVAISKGDNYFFGEYARNWVNNSPENFYHILDIEAGSPLLQKVYSELLRFIIDRVSYCGLEKPSNCTFVVPTDCTTKKKLEEAAKLQGINFISFETDAIAICSKYSLMDDGETSMVFDLGHSKLSVSIAKRNNNKIQLVSSHNNYDCCGRSFDSLVLQDILNTNIGVNQDNSLMINTLASVASHIKEDLSFKTEVCQSAIMGEYLIDRLRFNNIIAPLLSKAMQTCKETIDAAKISYGDIKQVFLCGGCSSIPCVEDFVKKLFIGNGGGKVQITNYAKHLDYQYDACMGAFYTNNSSSLTF